MTLFDRQSNLAKRFYGTADTVHQHAIESFFTAHESALRHKNDTESLAKSRAARSQIKAFATQHNLTVDDVRMTLTTILEHEAHPHGSEAIQTRWKQDYQSLCAKHGGEAGAAQAMARVENFQKAFGAAVPYLAERAAFTGAASDARIIDVCDRHGSKLPKG